MFKKNGDFPRCIEEMKMEGFFKVVQTADVSSENMRALPHDFVKNLSDNALSGKMKVKARWGSSWEIGISKNPIFYYMEKLGWEKFVRDSGLAENALLTLTHEENLRFSVNIFNHNGKEILQPSCRLSTAFLASSSRSKKESTSYKDMKKEEVFSSDSRRGETSGGGKHKKRKLSFCARPVIVERGASSSSKTEFSIVMKRTYLTSSLLPIPKSVVKHLMPNKTTKFVIRHAEDEAKSWGVVYLVREVRSIFSVGWRRLAQQYPLAVNDTCKFTFIKPHELLLQVSKP